MSEVSVLMKRAEIGTVTIRNTDEVDLGEKACHFWVVRSWRSRLLSWPWHPWVRKEDLGEHVVNVTLTYGDPDARADKVGASSEFGMRDA